MLQIFIKGHLINMAQVLVVHVHKNPEGQEWLVFQHLHGYETAVFCENRDADKWLETLTKEISKQTLVLTPQPPV